MVESLEANSDLKSQVAYKAQDSIVVDVNGSRLYLYEQANLTYDDFQLDAKRVRVDIEDQTL